MLDRIPSRRPFRLPIVIAALVAFAWLRPGSAAAADRLCDPAFEDCRAPLIDLIRNENVRIDVAFWFMEDTRYASELIKKSQAGVPVRVLMDTEANADYPGNVPTLQMLRDAHIPMRNKSGGSGILHWKLMLFAGQNRLEFSGANYSDEAFVPRDPYKNYVDEVIYFTDDSSIIDSFKTRYDDAWTDTTAFSNYANVTGTLTRAYPTYPIDPEMNFVPWQNFATRSVNAYKAETRGIDAIMYRITDRKHTDELIRARQRGVPIRLITEQEQYRDPTRLWDSWNVDRLYMAGVQVKFRGHEGLSHEKATLLYGQRMAIFGSSNWTSASASGQHEHNIFTTSKTEFFDWFAAHFDRKWNNRVAGSPETKAFTPLPPDAAVVKNPVNGAQNQALTVTLKWYAGPWAHKYDVFFGTNPASLTKIVDDVELGPSENTSDLVSTNVSGLAGGTTYYWRIVSRTMANLEASSATWSFRTEGAPPASGSSDVVLWAWRAATHPGWTVTADTSGAGGKRLANANVNAPKPSGPAASPSMYFDLTFSAQAGVPYRLWVRGKAQSNDYNNDSVYVQFSDSVTSSGGAQWRIGTTSATTVTIEDCSGCGLAGWGWNDNAAGANTLGPLVYFAATGTHTIRVQVREDGLSIDQIILSRDAFLNTAPGLTKSDGTIYAEQGGDTSAPPPPPPATLPSGWTFTDVGAVGAGGTASESSGTFTVSGAGADVWGSADAFGFAARTLTGDGAIVARVATVQNVNAWTKAGVMMRDGTGAGAAHAFMIATPTTTKGLSFQRRLTSGGSSISTTGAAVAPPYWVRLTRVGNTITAASSPNGTTWTTVGSSTYASLSSTLTVGLAVSSHVTGTTATATFDNVTVN